jgi:hypothetical protein
MKIHSTKNKLSGKFASENGKTRSVFPFLRRDFALRAKSGFALLFAVLAASLLVALGISIFDISLKELSIATSEQDSQTAYYVADSAEECALYWDLKQGAFPTCIGSLVGGVGGVCPVSTSTVSVIACNGNNISIPVFNGTTLVSTYATSTFFAYATATPIFGGPFPEAGIVVIKTYMSSASGDYIQTEIDAEGHNSGILGTRVERGISEVYNQ